MKRTFGTLVFMCVVGAALAQAPFTIVRPADGSKVREKVHVLIPKNSIPQGGYIGIFLNGKFVEAITPPMTGKYYDYVLDTKGRGIADGKVNLEAVLYVDYGTTPRVVDRSSVTVNVANSASIAIPKGGFKLRYKFVPGTELVYKMEQRMGISTISGTQNSVGGRPAELPIDSEKVRLLYAVDNAYGNGDGLVRIQALTDKGKDYTMLTTSEAAEPKKYFDYMMHPLYMRINSTGNEIFGSAPSYFAMEGTSGNTGEDVRTNLYAVFPLPTLPAKPVRPGDSWQSRFQNGALDLDKLGETTSIVNRFPARGEFLGVEWEMGHPCAKIKNSITQGTRSSDGKKLAAAGAAFSDDRVEMTEIIWFALDRGVIVKIQRETRTDRKLENQGGAGAPGTPGSPNGSGRGPLPSLSSAGGSRNTMNPPGSDRARGGQDGKKGPLPSLGTGMGGGNRTGGFGTGGGRSGGSNAVQYLRIRQQTVFTLEG